MTGKLKITVIAQDWQYANDIRKFLADAGKPYPLVAMLGGIQQVVAVAEQERPDLLVLEGHALGHTELQILSYVTSRFPAERGGERRHGEI